MQPERRIPAVKFICIILCLFWHASISLAQKGDEPGEIQALLVPPDKIPPSPILTPAEALKAFKLPPGFRIEIVAAEPMINSPVAAQWDPDGNLWVLEMPGFMNNPDGAGEDKPLGNLVMLTDTNNDAKMDQRTIIIDKLVMPRAFLVLSKGILLSEPPMLWWYPLRDGKPGSRYDVSSDYAKEADPRLGLKANPEHAANSLTWAMDNWIYSANYTRKFRGTDGDFVVTNTLFRGQWGFSYDDLGRLVFNSNSDPLRIDLLPSDYLARNPNYRGALGGNIDPVKNRNVWPIRVTPGVNRGYQPSVLRPDGKLAHFTAACGPAIYRGQNFPPEFYGNAFVCEPSANLVKRNILEDKDGVVSGRHAYEHDEFLASTDERFRPVNLYTGPDGALYVIDMYRGIIQHRYFLTTYLRKQAESRKMDKDQGMGRIYRIVHEGGALARKPALTTATSYQLINLLGHTNGWWRDTAQRLLIERNDPTAPPVLERRVRGNYSLASMHALWALDGMEQLKWVSISDALEKTDPIVIAAGIRLSERFLLENPDQTVKALAPFVNHSSLRVKMQLGLTLGQTTNAAAEELMRKIALSSGDNIYVRDSLVSGLGNREIRFLEKLFQETTGESAAVKSVAGALAGAIRSENKTQSLGQLLKLAAASKPWQGKVILDAIAPEPASGKGKAIPLKIINFPEQPDGLATLLKSRLPEHRGATNLLRVISWPGQPNFVAPPAVKALTTKEKERFEVGKTLYISSCGACHQLHGMGQEGLAPPLVDSPWATGPVSRLGRIVLQGVRGSISVKGQTWDMEMPGLAVFDDDALASLLTYIRREWGHTSDPISPETIAAIRKQTEAREEPWTEPELLKIK